MTEFQLEIIGQFGGSFENGWLNFSGSKITDADLPIIWTFPEVTRLLLCDDFLLTDRWLDACPQLSEIVSLEIENSPIGDAGLEKIPACFPNLVIINLKDTKTTIEGIARILPTCSKLTRIFHGGYKATAETEKVMYGAFHPLLAHDFFKDLG